MLPPPQNFILFELDFDVRFGTSFTISKLLKKYYNKFKKNRQKQNYLGLDSNPNILMK